MWMWILIGLDIITKVHGFANGNFPQSCDSLSPQHASGGTNFPAQTSAAPFRVDFESSNPADPITVVLRRNGSTEFKGFMMEAREAALAGRLIGSFIPLDGSTTRLLMCNGSAGSAVSQSNNQRKSLLKFNWTAPEINQDIVFRATFVQDFATFWENVTATFRLPTTTPAPSTTTTTPAPSTTTTTPAPRTTTTTPASRTTTTTPASSKTTINPTHTPNISGFVTKLGTALMCGDLSLELVKTDMPKIFVMAKGTHYRRFSEVSKTVVSILCLGVEIASLILFAVEFSSNEILVGLACAVIVINLTEHVIWSLTVRRKLEKSGILAGKVFFVVHQSFTHSFGEHSRLPQKDLATLLGVLQMPAVKNLPADTSHTVSETLLRKARVLTETVKQVAILYVSVKVNCGKNWRDFWLLKVLITLTVWIFLNAVWILGFSTTEIEEANEKGLLTFMFNSKENPLRTDSGSPEVHWRRVTSHPENKGSAQDQKTTRGFDSGQQNHSQQKQKKNHTAVQVIVSVLFIIGATSLAIAVIVGIFGCQKN